ncbi:hypothetical protein C450_09513 [Halococcus salifodinae DSM 8989]|uniref:Uncharacterized protein n=1 Tax=Halococcus salifodinae DSM 8989 TaxID=1227456 RepID=M0N686_9EURY|nr:hypothetical protein C450_09513 [Halococcus salifodinae DSM 8989]
MEYWLGKTPTVETLLFGEHCRVAILEVDVLPAEPLASLVAPISQYLRTPYAGIRQEIHQRAVATGLDRRLSILADVVDRRVCLLVDERGELLAILGGPRLLVSTLVTAVVWNGFGRVAALGDVLGEVALADGPPAERRDIWICFSSTAIRSGSALKS